MSKRIFHMISKDCDLNFIMTKFNISYQDILLNNPHLRGNGHYGQIIYINMDEKKSINYNEYLYLNLLLLQRLDIISYIYNYNDHILIEEQLFTRITELLKCLDNYQLEKLLFPIIKDLHSSIHIFIDALKNKLQDITTCRENIKNNLINIITILDQNNYNVDKKATTKHIEDNLISLAKLIKNNHYDSFNMLFEIK